MSLKYLLRGQLSFLSKYYRIVGLSSPGQDLIDVLEQENIEKVIPIKMERKISIFNDFVSLIRLMIVFFKEKPYAVHSITPKAGLLSMIAAKIVGVPIRIHTFTGLVFPTSKGLKRKILIVTDKITCWAATNIIPEGKGVMNDLIYHNITSKPLHILANGNVNGIDTLYYSCINKEKNKRTNFIFCFVGRMVRDKGINELVEAFIRLYKINNNIELVLVGPFEKETDPLLPHVEDLILNHPAISFKGWQNDVRLFLANADAFVFPSYREGFPNVVMQAGAMGLPSIVTDINGSNEIIIDGINGRIIPSKDEDALYSMMKYFLENPAEVEQMAGKAREMIVSRYDQQIVWDALLNEYRSILGA